MSVLKSIKSYVLSILSSILLFQSPVNAGSDLNEIAATIKDIEMRTGWRFVQAPTDNNNTVFVFDTFYKNNRDTQSVKVTIKDLSAFNTDLKTKGTVKLKTDGSCCNFPDYEKKSALEISKMTNWKLSVIENSYTLKFSFTDADGFSSEIENPGDILNKMNYYENPKIGFNRNIFFADHERHVAKIMAYQMNVDVAFVETNHSLIATFRDLKTGFQFTVNTMMDDFKKFAAQSGGAKKIKRKLFNTHQFVAAEDVSAKTDWKLKNIYFDNGEIHFEFTDKNYESLTTTEPKKILNKMVKSNQRPSIEDGLLNWTKATAGKCSALFN